MNQDTMNQNSSKSKLSKMSSIKNLNQQWSAKFSGKSKSKSPSKNQLNRSIQSTVSCLDENERLNCNSVSHVRVNKLKKEQRQDLSKSKRAKYASASLSAHRVLRDLKNTATKHLTNVKSSFDNLLSKVCIAMRTQCLNLVYTDHW